MESFVAVCKHIHLLQDLVILTFWKWCAVTGTLLLITGNLWHYWATLSLKIFLECCVLVSHGRKVKFWILDLKIKQQYAILLFKIFSVKILTVVNVLSAQYSKTTPSVAFNDLFILHTCSFPNHSQPPIPIDGKWETGWLTYASLFFLFFYSLL